MSSLSNLVIKHDSNFRMAMEQINKNSAQICFVVDQDNKLIGALSDGDIRRGFLRGATLESNIVSYMNTQPKFLEANYNYNEMLQKMKQWEAKQLPVVDKDNRVIKVEIFDQLIGMIKRSNRVVLMAGGKGLRLRPLTANTPKPLLPIAGVPILERIIVRFRDMGFSKFTICVNYLGEQIIDYFGSGEKLNAEIEYITETKEMGTCGSLALFKYKVKDPMIVMNADILTSADFSGLMNFHNSKSSVATMCVKEYTVDIPYGAIKISDHKIMDITEKPKEVIYINTGIYVLSSQALELVPEDCKYDMPSLFAKLNQKMITSHAYVMRDYWLDIGRPEDYYKAQFFYEDAIRRSIHE